jgi:hypothetical protein
MHGLGTVQSLDVRIGFWTVNNKKDLLNILDLQKNYSSYESLKLTSINRKIQ